MEIRVVTPIITKGLFDVEEFEGLVCPDTRLSHVEIDYGPASIESECDDALATPDTVTKIVEAESDGADAVVINCMGDPGLEAAREMVKIPVLGASETSMHLASILGHKFSVVTVLKELTPQFENQAKVYGVPDKLASVRSVNIPVLELEKDRRRLVNALTRESVSAIEEEGAHTIVFGCTGMVGCAEALQLGIVNEGYEGVPVIDPVVAAVKVAESLVHLELAHSKLSYPRPPEKQIVGYQTGQGATIVK